MVSMPKSVATTNFFVFAFCDSGWVGRLAMTRSALESFAQFLATPLSILESVPADHPAGLSITIKEAALFLP
jgi:hypothetical protein